MPPSYPLHPAHLTHTRLADEHRVVLGAPGQDLDTPPDFFVTANHGVELAIARGLRMHKGRGQRSGKMQAGLGSGMQATCRASGWQQRTHTHTGKYTHTHAWTCTYLSQVPGVFRQGLVLALWVLVQHLVVAPDLLDGLRRLR